MKIFVISDCHGNIEGLQRALHKAGITDKHGNRQLARRHHVVQLGDLANCVEDSKEGDLACLDLVGNVIDSMLIGNHEMPYLDMDNSFGGFHAYEEVADKIFELIDRDLLGPSVLVHKTLISHAGITAQLLPPYFETAKEVQNKIDYEWSKKNWNNVWFKACGHARGGRYATGGMLWCDFHMEIMPTPFPQIVGHTVGKIPRMKDNILCIDVGAKDPESEPFILELN